MGTFKATVMIQNGSSRLAHTIMVQAENTFGAQEIIAAQYGRQNIVSMPQEVVTNIGGYKPSPWM